MLNDADILSTFKHNITTESELCAFVWRIIFFVLKNELPRLMSQLSYT